MFLRLARPGVVHSPHPCAAKGLGASVAPAGRSGTGSVLVRRDPPRRGRICLAPGWQGESPAVPLANRPGRSGAGVRLARDGCALGFRQRRDLCPPVLAELQAWRRDLLDDPDGPLDAEELMRMLALRLSLAEDLGETHRLSATLRGNPQGVWDKMAREWPEIRRFRPWSGLPVAFTGFARAWISRWCGHRLPGRPEAPSGPCNPWRHRALLTVWGGDLLGRRTGHSRAISIWCRNLRLTSLRLNRGRVFLHWDG